MSEKTSIELVGAKELENLFKSFPYAVSKRAKRTGVRKAGQRMRTLVRRDAPRDKGNLRKSIGVYKTKSGAVKVGLNVKTPGDPDKFGAGKRVRFYYKTLDLPSKRGGALHPWFLKSVERHAPGISNLMIAETKKALYREAGKAYSKSVSKLRR